MLLNAAISRIGVPLEIIAFDETGYKPTEVIIKPFNKHISDETMRDRMAWAAENHLMGGNSDGESILYAYNRLIQQRNKRKIMIVLSDGSPASCRGDADWFTKQVVKEIEKKREVELYGIGIMDSNVERIYKHHAVINRAEDLEDAIQFNPFDIEYPIIISGLFFLITLKISKKLVIKVDNLFR